MEPLNLLMLWQMRLRTFWMEASVLPNNKFTVSMDPAGSQW